MNVAKEDPDSIELIPSDRDGNYAYLMIFEDGNRIDLQFTASTYEDDGENCGRKAWSYI